MAFGSNGVSSDSPIPEIAHEALESTVSDETESSQDAVPAAMIGHPGREMFTGEFTNDEILQVENIAVKALEKLTAARSYFRENDILRRVMEKSQADLGEAVVEKNGFEAMAKFVVQNLELLAIGDTGFLTTPRIAAREKQMLSLAGYTTDHHVLNKKLVSDAIARKAGISEEQTAAVEAACLSNRRVTVIEGTAGAGKSFTMQAIKDAYEKSGYTVLGTALGWNAAKVLESSAELSNCVAMAGLLKEMEQARKAGVEYFRKPTLLIVDEAGMVDADFMHRLLEETHHSSQPVKVVLTGDSLQLNPVNAGNALQAIVDFHGTTRIDTIRRQKRKSHRLAVKRFSQREAGKGLYPFVQQEALTWCEDKDDVINKVVRDFLSYRHAYPTKKALILALSNKDVVDLNKRVRAAYRKMGLIAGPDVQVQVTDGRETWDANFAVGDEVVVRANSKDLLVYDVPKDPNDLDVTQWTPTRTGVFNRNIGRVAAVRRSRSPVGSFDLHIDLTGEQSGRIVLNTQRFRHQEKPAFPVVHNFATTIYASQGQTVNKVLLLDNPRMEFRLAYVGMSRHTDSVDIYLDQSDIQQRMDKMLGKTDALTTAIAQTDPSASPSRTVRYRRTEMLQTVALNWAKDSVNLTVMIFDRERRLGNKVKLDEQALALVARASSQDPVTDFDETHKVKAGDTLNSIMALHDVNPVWAAGWKKNVRKWNPSLAPGDDDALPVGQKIYLAERTNRPYPLIDMDALMALPDPASATDGQILAAPEVVKAVTPSGVPLRQKHDSNLPVVPPKVSEQDEGLLSRAWEWNVPALNLPVPSLGKDGADGASPASPVASPSPLFDATAPSEVKVEVPMLPMPTPVAVLDEQDLLRFADGPQGVSEHMINATREVWWGLGRGDEPRVFARDRQGEIVARYALDGRCVVGEGYPPMLLNVKGNPTTPILIAPGVKEWLWAHEHNQKKTDLANAPHVVWGASGVEWQWIAPALHGKTVKIARARDNDAHAEWAQSLQQELWSKWQVKAEISPKLAHHHAPWDPKAAPKAPLAPVAAPSPAASASRTLAPPVVASEAPAPRRSLFPRR